MKHKVVRLFLVFIMIFSFSGCTGGTFLSPVVKTIGGAAIKTVAMIYGKKFAAEYPASVMLADSFCTTILEGRATNEQINSGLQYLKEKSEIDPTMVVDLNNIIESIKSKDDGTIVQAAFRTALAGFQIGLSSGDK